MIHQVMGDTIGALIKGGVGQTGVAVAGGDALRVLGGAGGNQCGQIGIAGIVAVGGVVLLQPLVFAVGE
ncbi:hypothetical protein WKI13_10710 [Teredinibacter turnerae]|uniref:hypothetical protein n=1 Tax=Teredinibacter turnerae TaxID=2426 RepID=UPI0030D4A1B4